MPAPPAVVDDRVEDGNEHVEPFDREARLAGEGAVQELLECLDLAQPIEQGRAVDRHRPAGGTPPIRRPGAATRALRARRCARSRSRSWTSRPRAARQSRRARLAAPRGGRPADQAGRKAAQIVFGQAVRLRVRATDRPAAAPPSGSSCAAEVSVAPDAVRQIDGADHGGHARHRACRLATVDRGRLRSGAGAQPDSNSLRVSASTEAGSWRKRS